MNLIKKDVEYKVDNKGREWGVEFVQYRPYDKIHWPTDKELPGWTDAQLLSFIKTFMILNKEARLSLDVYEAHLRELKDNRSGYATISGNDITEKSITALIERSLMETYIR